MTRPVIGLSCYLEPAKWGSWDALAAIVQWTYITKLQSAGAVVVVLPPNGHSAEAIARLDGLVLAGGADINPELYGASALPTTDEPRFERDTSEINLYLAARAKNIPILGICRGLQVMAVAHGGTLHQHLPDNAGSVAHRSTPGKFAQHQARFVEGSLIRNIIEVEEHTVNSSHHQGVDSPGDLTISGWAQDGTVEACEDPNTLFTLGVQWHPEASDDEIISERIFDAFVSACQI